MQIMDIPGSSLSSFPRINKIQFPSGELPRPAVIGLSGNCGTYINNASAIKEILASVLNIQDNLKSTLTDIEASQEDSDVENLEDSSSGGFTEESDSDSDHFPLSTRVQDMLFKRSSVSQDILETESSIALETDPVTCQMQVSITNALKPALEFLPFLKPDSCPEAVLQKRDINTQVKFPDTQKEGRRFSSPNIYHNFTLSETTINCTSGNLALPISANVSDSAACNRQDEKLCQRSQSYSSVLKALDTSFTAKTEMCPSTENAFEPTVLLENENAHFFVADMFISVVENLKSSLQTMYYQQWIADIQGFYPTWFNNHTESCVSRQKRLSESAVSVDSGYEGLVAMQQNFLTHNEHNSKFCCEWQNFKDTPTDEHDFEQCAFWHNSPMTALVEREFKHGALWQNSPSDPSKESDSRYGALWQNSPRDPSDENASKQRALWVNSPTNDLLGAHSEYCLETTCSTAEDGAKMCLNSEEHSDSDEFVIIEMDDNKYHMGEVTELSIKTKRDNPAPGSNSAEQTVKKLYRAFRQQWVQHEENLHSATIILNVEKEDIMAEEFESSVRLAEEIRKFRMREAEEWTPPRFQIINVIHPSPKRDVIVASQNYMCAGCGTKVEPRYINRLRYCEYLGKYFCDCCHSNSLTFIPGQILLKWNFSKYYVSNFSKKLVDTIWQSYKFNVLHENPEIYKKVKDLHRIQELQVKLISIKKLLMTCRLNSVLNPIEEIPSHLTEELHLFTLNDLFKVKQKLLLPELREVLAAAITHVHNCELCQAKGFICEFCHNPEVIFPFQTETCKRCEDCKTCYHKQCFTTRDCPKCHRIERRKALRMNPPSSVLRSRRNPT